MSAARVYVGLGSNLASPTEQLRQAICALQALPRSQWVGVSGFYSSESLLPGQPRYTNAVAAFDTTLAPLALLDALQAIENAQGRVRSERWGPRTLDVDILIYGEQVIDQPRLKVPHEQLHLRPFVLYPLAELVPEHFVLADGRPLAALLQACPFQGLERLPTTR
ncbi:2-amino-4-hydroxy-6-hydroxymethyldihydropteridine diphosphokinase [Pseudomonas typographi]|uniref:2-amino-4-hydroxy-6-hydroxymethyldihydropteridine pyrophosphokinase n=1 Tax=Pseudomonas typographi TaxID=2715964 RepID=A0ABR7Z696_9PSED|nr:2-amino-4-hydroxy-6-hydroxymethyldihydropteridine diphosphokinase [Pseudomonas typographi]MBD1553745.1 2-amino-4-hydroxy-6-hydroxymethyldihydropteridine diphosphokinase [Pseudomonas typographi]MBD1589194.1 2-amino-4-hydroxy-6-hydroxymethyldihydropteridine diphosphokinase [Pseudomonas typographi]MBD1601031.1 2-amino-4-hydroxy-6-hydroxymethyldihydropteridine diphosphokinase [Pseudomonas typographi]